MYVGGDGGVVRSTDKGTSWTQFPSLEAGSLPTTSRTRRATGGGLPTAHINDLDLSIGNVDPTTGRSIAQPGDPNVLLATTYGSGSFAIRLAPVVFAGTLAVDPNLPTAGSATTSGGVTTVTTRTPTIDGVSEQTAFGNVARITLLDLSDPNHPVPIGGYDPSRPDDLQQHGLPDRLDRPLRHPDQRQRLQPATASRGSACRRPTCRARKATSPS